MSDTECGHEETTRTGKGNEWKCDLCGLIYTPERQRHTPGPWRYFNYAGSDFGICEDSDGRDGRGARDFGLVRGDDDEAEANAALISSAPELLEACKQFAQFCDNGNHPQWATFFTTIAGKKFRAAIAKAEGNQ
jgi:hypothetical protein